MKDVKLASVLSSWQTCSISHPLYMWALIDTSTGGVVKFFLFYKQVKFNNMTRNGSVAKIIREWTQEKRKELRLNPNSKGEFLVRRDQQTKSQQVKDLLTEISHDFNVIYVDDLAAQGLPWGDTLLETLCDLGNAAEHRDVLIKMQTLPLEPGDVALLRRGFAAQVERSHLSLNGLNARQEAAGVGLPAQKAFTAGNGDEGASKEEAFNQPPTVTPDLVIAPNMERTWLSKVGEELEEWAVHEEAVMTHKPLREAWTEAMKIKRELEEQMTTFCSQMRASQQMMLEKQERMLEKQDLGEEKFHRLSDVLEEIRSSLQKRKTKKAKPKPFRDEVRDSLYEKLMSAPLPRSTHRAHVERARKRIVFALLYYTEARVNELRRITYNNLRDVMNEGRLKLVLYKQKEAIERVVPTLGREEIRTLVPDISLFFIEQRHQFLGKSYRKPGQLMHEKAWIS